MIQLSLKLNPKTSGSQTESTVDELISWSTDNRKNINTRKTKEMVLGPLAHNPPQQLNIGNLTVDRVAQYKVLGVTVSQSLKWNDHMTNICSKLNKRLYFFKGDMQRFFTKLMKK